MSFSSILKGIKHKTPPAGQPNSSGPTTPSQQPALLRTNSTQKSPSHHKNQYDLPPQRHKVDPAVQRLKELRRQEKEAKEAASASASQKKRAQASSARRSTTPRSRQAAAYDTTSRVHSAPVQPPTTRSTSPAKRLTFAELMKQGQQKTRMLSESSKEPSPVITEHKYQSKTQPLGGRFQSKSRPPPPPPQRTSSSASASARHTTSLSSKGITAGGPRSKYVIKPPPPATPKPVAQPSAKLRAKLEARKKSSRPNPRSSSSKPYYDVEEDYDSEELDFIVDDEEEEEDVAAVEDVGYDRDEIWKMFNKGRTRRDFDDVDDDDDDLYDMEADGDEILREEERAAKRARLEEKKELELERRRVEEKRRRLGKK